MDTQTDDLIEHDLIQGSPEWLAFRMNHDGASEASVMLGLSSKTSRTELLRIKSSGIAKEFSDWVQKNVLDYGHEVEALARPIVAKQHGIRLFPMVYSRGRLSASCDGVTMVVDTGWEHKQKNDALFAAVSAGKLPDEYMPQPQQCLMVTGAKRWIFTVSDGTEENMVSMEILPDPAWFERIRAGWSQFNKDRENYVHIEYADKPQADTIMDLPALSVHATGMVTYSNLPEFKEAANSYIAKINTSLQTDEDFANAEATVKFCKATEERLEITKSAILAQTATIDEVIRAVDHIQAQLRDKRLMLDKLVTKEKDARKLAIVNKAGNDFSAHVQALESEIRPIQLTVQRPDFGGAIKGMKKLAAMQDAIDTALANGKIHADTVAKDVRDKLAWCKENAAGMSMLFPDLQQIIVKPLDDFKLLITSRIEAHKKAEADKLEAERTRIQAEEEAKARAKVEAEQAEFARQDAQWKAQQEAETKAKAKAEQEAAEIEERRKQAQLAESAQLQGKAIPKRPSDAVILTSIAGSFGVTIEEARTWIMDVAENLKVSA